MTAPDDRLISLFADGAMPTGENFKTLITSMATKVEFDQQKSRFDEYVAKGVVHLGPMDKGWSVTVDGTNTLAFVPDVLDDLPRGKAHFDAYGWTRGFGRMGIDGDDAPFSDGPLLSRDKMDAKPCGEWVPLVQTPSGLSAFEVVVATDQFAPAKHHVVLRWLFKIAGIEPTLPDIAHAVATTRDVSVKPEISRTNPNRFTQTLDGAPLAAAIFAVALFVLFLIADGLGIAPDTDQSFLMGLAVFGLAALRRCVQLVTLRKSDIRLRWKKAKESDSAGVKGHVLEVYAPKPVNQPEAKFNYHITALWA